MTDETTPPTGLRARQREERRAQLVKVARGLLEMDGATGFSMPDLAKQAGVSLATPYNLFGSKAEILHAVAQADLDSLHRALANGLVTDPIGTILASADILAGALARRPNFYRVLSHSLSELGPAEIRRLVLPLGDAILTPAVRAIDAAGLLQPIIPASAVAVQLARLFESCFLHWSALDWSEARLAVELRVGIVLLLLGVATYTARPRLTQALETMTHLPPDQFIYNAL